LQNKRSSATNYTSIKDTSGNNQIFLKTQVEFVYVSSIRYKISSSANQAASNLPIRLQ